MICLKCQSLFLSWNASSSSMHTFRLDESGAVCIDSTCKVCALLTLTIHKGSFYTADKCLPTVVQKPLLVFNYMWAQELQSTNRLGGTELEMPCMTNTNSQRRHQSVDTIDGQPKQAQVAALLAQGNTRIMTNNMALTRPRELPPCEEKKQQ